MSSAVPGIIVKRDEQELAEWLSTERGFLHGFGRFNGAPIKLEPYQSSFMDWRLPDGKRPRFRWVTKARQIGFSWSIALEALARCHLRAGHTSIFVSYNLEDAKEKVAIARAVYEDLPLSFQKRLAVDSKTELVFETGSRRRAEVSRIVSNPSRAPRGKHGDVYLDELAHYTLDQEVYRGSTALTLRSGGQLTGCSTPLGRRGVFWEIARQEIKPYRHHKRWEIPWWLCSFFCTDVPAAAVIAPHMPTSERVARFGTDGIKEQFDSLPLEDFQQEFECIFVDESFSFFPYELILPCTFDDLVVADDPTDVPRPKGRLVFGVDIGRTHDKTEITGFEQRGEDYTCRMMRTFSKTPFREQEAELRRILKILPVARMSIDATGIGHMLAESLAQDFPGIVKEETFSNESKERWATHLKVVMQNRRIALPRRRELVSQFHSIRRRVTAGGRVAYDAERTSAGHADKFWSIALACRQEGDDEGREDAGFRCFE